MRTQGANNPAADVRWKHQQKLALESRKRPAVVSIADRLRAELCALVRSRARLPDSAVERVDQLHRLVDLIPEFTRYLRDLKTQLVSAIRAGRIERASVADHASSL